MNHRFGWKIGDILLMAILLLTAVLLFLLPFFANKGTIAEIVIAETGEVQAVSLDMNAEYEISSRGVYLTVCVKDGEVLVSHSDCLDGICSSTPAISRGGQSIVCAPAGVVIRIIGEEAMVDGVSG